MSNPVTYIGGPEDGRRINHCCAKSLAGRIVVTRDDGSEAVYRLERLPEAGGTRLVYVLNDAAPGAVIEYLLLTYHARVNSGIKGP